jgi:flagellar hook-associated protein 2
MGSVATTPSGFNGTSTYAGSLQNVINQAVTIASIPLTQLQDNVTALQGQASELGTLQTDFAAIQTALQTLSSTTGGGSLSATVGDNTVATASVDPGTAIAAGTYGLNVINAGSSTTTLSNANLPTVSDPTTTSISTASSYTLTVGTSTFTITPTADNLDALAQAINGANAGVTATLVNLGSSSAPSYRLSVQSTALGDIPIQLSDGSNLLSTLTTGAPAQYQVDGQPTTPISSSSSTVTLAPGVTVNLLKVGDTTVTVAEDPSAAANALSAFATAYNAAVTELNKNHGTTGGALTGESIVSQLQQSLNGLVNYSGGTGTVHSMDDLGLTFNSQGQLVFNQAQFESVSASDPNGVASFLGTPTGTGFLASATNEFNGLLQPSTGLFDDTNEGIQQQINSDDQQISDTQARITTMQNNLNAQMSAADSMIASLQSQVSYFTTLFQDENTIQTNGG